MTQRKAVRQDGRVPDGRDTPRVRRPSVDLLQGLREQAVEARRRLSVEAPNALRSARLARMIEVLERSVRVQREGRRGPLLSQRALFRYGDFIATIHGWDDDLPGDFE